MAVGVEYHGGLSGMGIENTMVNGVGCFDKTGGYVGLVLGSMRALLVKSTLKY